VTDVGNRGPRGETDAKDHDESAGGQIRALRSGLGLTQEQLARELGVSFATVNRWETGRRAPSKSSQHRIDALATSGAARADSVRREVAESSMLVPSTPFVGREVELQELEGLLKANRLLTLTGSGGSGKTRLAVELLRRCAGREELVTVVALDVVSDPSLVASAVCAALGVRRAPGVSPASQVTAHLATGRRILLLDNCEHVVTETRRLAAAALAHAPHVRILATSRTVLGVVGEQVWTVPPLGIPADHAGPAEVARCDAGRLFLERAQSRWSDFALDDETAPSVARICRLVDGLPLALELAAAWASVLSAADLTARLEKGFAILDTGTGPGRHDTLRATVEWSDSLLDPADRVLFGQLAVFAGQFTLDDAEAVAQVADGGDVVVALRHLVDSSWLVAQPGGRTTTYGLLNTLRTYGRELLERSGQGENVHRRHAVALTTLAEGSEDGLAGPDQAFWRARMEQATGDLEQALGWTLGRDEVELSLRLVASLWRWWYTTGRIVEGRRWARAALRRSRPVTPSLRGRALYAGAVLASENGDYVVAADQAMSAYRTFEAIADHRGMARSSTILGNVAKYRGDLTSSRGHLTQAVASQRATGDDWGTAVALQNLAALEIDQANLSAGRALMEESLALKRRAGDQRSLGYGLVNLSDLLVRELNLDRARAALAEAASIADGLDDKRLAAFVHHNLGDIAGVAGDHGEAVVCYENAVQGFRLAHDPRDVALALCSLGSALISTGAREAGVLRLAESEVLAADIGDELRLSEARAALAKAAIAPAADLLPGGLTARQAEVLGLVASGLSNRAVSEQLRLSTATVERHLANVYLKLGVTNRVGATRYALAHGLGVRVNR
jgi:predicted ATPase/DNA-binding CsgD family transcriptional regulator/DNA-binding XRE family transcriptional regulator